MNIKGEEEIIKPTYSRFHRHVKVLVWKAYLQRQRRWRLLLLETLFSGTLFLLAVYVAKPVFLTPIQVEQEPSYHAVYPIFKQKFIIGYAPNIQPYNTIMNIVAERLDTDIIAAQTEDELNDILYNRSRKVPIKEEVIWIIWYPKEGYRWKFSIRSTGRARYVTGLDPSLSQNSYFRSGFLKVQISVSSSIIEYVSNGSLYYAKFELRSMPVSPLMQEPLVRRAISNILICYTMALLPAVLETEALVVTETKNRFKRALRIRNVSFSSIYVAWMVYAYMTALPMCLLGAIALILIFRWIHLVYTLTLVLVYTSLMIMMALIMAMFHNRACIACIWTTLFTLLQTFLADLLVHHEVDNTNALLTFLLHIMIPPLGLVHEFNEFALLETGKFSSIQGQGSSIIVTLFSWILMILIHFGVLMGLQRTLKERAIGGQVSWKSIIFKEVENKNRLRPIETPTGRERDQLQEVDELMAKAISFRNVSKVIMGGTVLDKITLDIYRGEFTMLYAEQVQQRMITTVEDLLTGLTYPDHGTINILGENMEPGNNLMSKPYMTGYCHRSDFLIHDLTVEEHMNLFFRICLWHESNQYLIEFSHVRQKKLFSDCDLDGVRHEYVRHLDSYYRAQLCWALAVLLEPRVVIIPNYTDSPTYVSVIKDKIMEYKKYLTIVKMCFSSIALEFADRVFLFDNKLLVFGGSPAYMFFKFGREYRVRITFPHGSSMDEEVVVQLLNRAAQARATVRAHLGSLLILKLPTSPTADVAAFVKDLTENSEQYGILSMNISLPDSEEVCNRAIHESRASGHETSATHYVSRIALREVAEPVPWKRNLSLLGDLHLKTISWKFCTFFVYYRFYMIVTIISALLAGVFIGISLSKLLSEMETGQIAKILLQGQVMTVESLEQKTTLVLRLDTSERAMLLANAYVMSETGATEKQIEHIGYTALSSNDSITEYLVTRAIDSPQQYVYMFAYGMDVTTYNYLGMEFFQVKVLYSPIHNDEGAAVRSCARFFMAAFRYTTKHLDATIQVVDDPLALDLTPWLRPAADPPLLIQILLILTIAHITLIPSKEYGYIRHTQSYSLNFSPFGYWMSLYVCDLLLYCILVMVMTGAMLLIMFLIAPSLFEYLDLVIIPFMLIVYGIGCIPQAYLFSLSEWSALNSMFFIIFNILFGETTVVAKLLYGDALNYVLHFMILSPQFNMAYALVKIRQIFFYNSECIVFKRRKLCGPETIHKCCKKCGILQECFSKKSYMTQDGLLMETIAMLTTALVFTTLLLLWEYKVAQRLLTYVVSNWVYTNKTLDEDEAIGVKKEKKDVKNKIEDLRRKLSRENTFGECLLAHNVSRKHAGEYVLRDISLGLSKGEALALSGLRHYGRVELCETLAGYRLPSDGELWAMSKWKLQSRPYMYSRNISLSSEHDPLPHWMTVYDALEMIAALRGVPKIHLKAEVMKYIDALELSNLSHKFIIKLDTNDRKRVAFASAVIAAPPVLILDECTAFQKYSVRRAMYFILHHLRKRGHAILISSRRVETHMPVTNRLAILVDGHIYDIDEIESLVERYSNDGYTVVVHLKYEIDITKIFSKYFKNFTINDSTEVLVNMQVLDDDLNWANIFEKMEKLQYENHVVYSYVVLTIPIDYIYNTILISETGNKPMDKPKFSCLRYLLSHKPKVRPSKETLEALVPYEKKYDITTLKELPWSVIFNR